MKFEEEDKVVYCKDDYNEKFDKRGLIMMDGIVKV